MNPSPINHSISAFNSSYSNSHDYNSSDGDVNTSDYHIDKTRKLNYNFESAIEPFDPSQSNVHSDSIIVMPYSLLNSNPLNHIVRSSENFRSVTESHDLNSLYNSSGNSQWGQSNNGISAEIHRSVSIPSHNLSIGIQNHLSLNMNPVHIELSRMTQNYTSCNNNSGTEESIYLNDNTISSNHESNANIQRELQQQDQTISHVDNQQYHSRDSSHSDDRNASNNRDYFISNVNDNHASTPGNSYDNQYNIQKVAQNNQVALNMRINDHSSINHDVRSNGESPSNHNNRINIQNSGLHYDSNNDNQDYRSLNARNTYSIGSQQAYVYNMRNNEQTSESVQLIPIHVPAMAPLLNSSNTHIVPTYFNDPNKFDVGDVSNLRNTSKINSVGIKNSQHNFSNSFNMVDYTNNDTSQSNVNDEQTSNLDAPVNDRHDLNIHKQSAHQNFEKNQVSSENRRWGSWKHDQNRCTGLQNYFIDFKSP